MKMAMKVFLNSGSYFRLSSCIPQSLCVLAASPNLVNLNCKYAHTDSKKFTKSEIKDVKDFKQETMKTFGPLVIKNKSKKDTISPQTKNKERERNLIEERLNVKDYNKDTIKLFGRKIKTNTKVYQKARQKDSERSDDYYEPDFEPLNLDHLKEDIRIHVYGSDEIFFGTDFDEIDNPRCEEYLCEENVDPNNLYDDSDTIIEINKTILSNETVVAPELVSKISSKTVEDKKFAPSDKSSSNKVKTFSVKVLTKSTEKEEVSSVDMPMVSNKHTECSDKDRKNDRAKMYHTETNTHGTNMVQSTEKDLVSMNYNKNHNEIMKVGEILKYIHTCSLTHKEATSEDQAMRFHDFVESLELKNLPSVSKIINETQSERSKDILNRWKIRMIEDMGEVGFKKYQKEKFQAGSTFHTSIQKFLTGEDMVVKEENEKQWQSIQHVFKDIKETVATEVPILHKNLYYQGKFDCISTYKNKLCLIDWKTSDRHKPFLSNTYDQPLQLAAYMGAINNSTDIHNLGVKQLDYAALVIAYNGGDRADVHVLGLQKCEKYWNEWLKRVHMYWKMQAEKLKDSEELQH